VTILWFHPCFYRERCAAAFSKFYLSGLFRGYLVCLHRDRATI
jgi:hypothetical protein